MYQPNLFEPLESSPMESTSSTADFPVKTSRSRAKAKGSGPKPSQRIGPVCGGKCGASCEKCDPVGYSLRTCLASALAGLTSCCYLWKNSGTPLGRSWWVLTMSEPRIDESASGLSLWPTPQAWDSDRGTNTPGGRRGVNLIAKVKANWPTIYGNGNVDASGKRGGACELAMAAKYPDRLRGGKVRLSDPPSSNWPTPRVSADRTSRSALLAKQWASPSLAQAAELSEGILPREYENAEELKPCAQRMWATPAASMPNDAEDPKTFLASKERLREKGINGNGCGTPLAIQAKLSAPDWPTLTARDHRSGHASAETHAKNSRPLSEVAVLAGQPDPESLNTAGRPPGFLNPAFVEQLMGFPDGWTDV